MWRKSRARAGQDDGPSTETGADGVVDGAAAATDEVVESWVDTDIDAGSLPDVDAGFVVDAEADADADAEAGAGAGADVEANADSATDATAAVDSEADVPRVVAPASPANEHEEAFWGGRALGREANDEAFAAVINIDDDTLIESETLAYMGSVPRTRVDPAELVALAEWAESKTCRMCRRKIRELHDPDQLKHDECRTALRVSRLLRRYT